MSEFRLAHSGFRYALETGSSPREFARRFGCRPYTVFEDCSKTAFFFAGRIEEFRVRRRGRGTFAGKSLSARLSERLSLTGVDEQAFHDLGKNPQSAFRFRRRKRMQRFGKTGGRPRSFAEKRCKALKPRDPLSRDLL